MEAGPGSSNSIANNNFNFDRVPYSRQDSFSSYETARSSIGGSFRAHEAYHNGEGQEEVAVVGGRRLRSTTVRGSSGYSAVQDEGAAEDPDAIEVVAEDETE